MILLALLIAIDFMVALFFFEQWRHDLLNHRRQKWLSQRVGLSSLTDLQKLETMTEPPPVLQKLSSRLTQSLLLYSRRWLTPQHVRKEIATKLYQAGNTSSPEAFMLTRVALALALTLTGVFVSKEATMLPTRLHLVIPIGMGAIGYLFPGIHLRTAAKKHLTDLESALPEVFDILSMSMTAGLAFDGALRQMVSHLTQEPAHQEFFRTLSDMQLGLSRAEALMALAIRTQSPELKRFAQLVTQADRTGSGLAQTLRIQAKEIKELRASQARQKAALIPVKIIFPMIIFIFPAIFLIVLGPALLSLLKVF